MTSKDILLEADILLKSLLDCKPKLDKDVPREAGVYIVYNKDHKVIYTGKARNLRRRIWDDHMGADEKMSTSTLRRSIHKVHSILPGRSIQTWMHQNCSFSYIIIPDHDMRDLVEALTIIYLRRQGNDLLNFHRT